MTYWILLLVSLAFSAVGFLMYIYFFSVGYGLAVAALGVTLAASYFGKTGAAPLVLCALLVVYGLRLGLYLLYRDLKSKGYRKILAPERDRSKRMKLLPKFAIWFSCAVLYTLEISPVYFRLKNGVTADAALYAGLAVAVFGLLLEAAADLQKSVQKKRDPSRFVSTGLYRIVRCPNYLGELLFWLGVLISGIPALKTPWEWAAAITGYVLLIFIMFSGARRLELRQEKNYGDDPAYRAYVGKTPILLPFVPLYSVKKWDFLVF